MGAKTGIAWTDATFNIAWGCMKVSDGCRSCYADTLSKRYGARKALWGPAATTQRRTLSAEYWRKPLLWNQRAQAAGVRMRVFCSSMCDVFEDHPTIDAERAKLWPLIRATPWLDWQLLTKRPERIESQLPEDWEMGWPNVWLGVSVEHQGHADRVTHLAETRAVRRFISAEPLLGPLTFAGTLHDAAFRGFIHWVIIGGESGPNARPMDLDWARALRDEAREHGVAVFFKQRSGPRAGMLDGVPDDLRLQEFPA